MSMILKSKLTIEFDYHFEEQTWRKILVLFKPEGICEHIACSECPFMRDKCIRDEVLNFLEDIKVEVIDNEESD